MLPRGACLIAVAVTVACGKQQLAPGDGPPTDSALASSTTLTAPNVLLDAEPAPELKPEPEREPETAPEPPTPSPLGTTCDGVSLVLVSVKVVPPSYVGVLAELRNASAVHVPLMLPGDGSTEGRRNPTVNLELKPNAVAPALGCGMTNPISSRNFAFLAPGEKRSLDPMPGPTPAKAGRYTLRATYTNDPTSAALGSNNKLGSRADALVARARRTVPCTLVSNAISFVWNDQVAP